MLHVCLRLRRRSRNDAWVGLRRNLKILVSLSAASFAPFGVWRLMTILAGSTCKTSNQFDSQRRPQQYDRRGGHSWRTLAPSSENAVRLDPQKKKEKKNKKFLGLVETLFSSSQLLLHRARSKQQGETSLTAVRTSAGTCSLDTPSTDRAVLATLLLGTICPTHRSSVLSSLTDLHAARLWIARFSHRIGRHLAAY